MVFLISISLILHLFTFLWIIILMQKINMNQTGPNDFQKVKSEIEDILLSYTEEMKDENEKLLVEIKKMKIENEKLNKKIANTEKQVIANETLIQKQQARMPVINLELQPGNETIQPKNNNQIEKYDDYEPPMIEEETEEEDIFEQSDTVKVLSLAKQGFNAEQIAKKLDLGKGEVELVLKFYQNSK